MTKSRVIAVLEPKDMNSFIDLHTNLLNCDELIERLVKKRAEFKRALGELEIAIVKKYGITEERWFVNPQTSEIRAGNKEEDDVQTILQ